MGNFWLGKEFDFLKPPLQWVSLWGTVIQGTNMLTFQARFASFSNLPVLRLSILFLTSFQSLTSPQAFQGLWHLLTDIFPTVLVKRIYYGS